MSKTVFITGATGYIGGAILARLLETPSTKSYTYRALVRSEDKAARLKQLNVHPVVATIDDGELLAAEAERADIVVHTAASADHLPSSRAILSGLKKKGGNPILIHVSGTGVLDDDARGEYGTEEVYSDLDSEHMNRLPDNAMHRNVDLNVLAAASYVRTHIILPPTIYGLADHALVKAGISSGISIQIPSLIRAGIERGQGGVIGKGLNIWSNVHIDDIATAVVTILEAAVAGRTGTGLDGYYFAETGEHRLYDVCAEISRVLSTHGIGKPEPTLFTDAEIQKNYGSYGNAAYYIGSNSRSRADRTRQLGWSSVRTTTDFIMSLAPEVEYFLKEGPGLNKQ